MYRMAYYSVSIQKPILSDELPKPSLLTTALSDLPAITKYLSPSPKATLSLVTLPAREAWRKKLVTVHRNTMLTEWMKPED